MKKPSVWILVSALLVILLLTLVIGIWVPCKSEISYVKLLGDEAYKDADRKQLDDMIFEITTTNSDVQFASEYLYTYKASYLIGNDVQFYLLPYLLIDTSDIATSGTMHWCFEPHVLVVDFSEPMPQITKDYTLKKSRLSIHADSDTSLRYQNQQSSSLEILKGKEPSEPSTFEISTRIEDATTHLNSKYTIAFSWESDINFAAKGVYRATVPVSLYGYT